MALKLIKKMDAITSASTLNLSVSKTSEVSTSVEVGSTGSDDKSFTDKQLTPGPASMPLKSEKPSGGLPIRKKAPSGLN